MSDQQPESLAEAMPTVSANCDLTRLSLSAEEGYVLSRFDGRTTVSEVCDLVGLAMDRVTGMLERFAELGAVDPLPDVVMGAFSELELEQRETIDRFLSALPTMSHFEVLGLAVNADPADIKRGYLRSSKQFHPDRFLGKKLGIYGRRLGVIFRAIKEAYDVLRDDEKRALYQTGLGPLTEAPAAPEVVSSPAPVAEQGVDRSESDADREARLEAHRQSIKRNRAQKRVGKPPPADATPARADHVLKAKEYFHSGEKLLKEGDLAGARASFKLAVAHNPKENAYRQALRALD